MGVEAACGLLEVAWRGGLVAAVEAALLPLQTLSNSSSLDQRGPPVSSPCQQQVSYFIYQCIFYIVCILFHSFHSLLY